MQWQTQPHSPETSESPPAQRRVDRRPIAVVNLNSGNFNASALARVPPRLAERRARVAERRFTCFGRWPTLLALVAVFACARDGLADGWSLIEAEAIANSAGPRMCYDINRGCCVLYTSAIKKETWELDDAGWQLRSVDANTPFGLPALVFDASRSVSVLFGGTDIAGGDSGDTWEWNGSLWNLTAFGQARTRHAMTYDTDRRVTVMFGGYSQAEDDLLVNTWEYDGSEWAFRVYGVPPGRMGHAMTYDSWRHQTLMYGGGADQWDLWAWDGQTWTLLDDSLGRPDVPRNRHGHTMVFDSRRGVTMLFGGSTQGHVSNDLWEWDGQAWSKVNTPIAPPKRADHAMCYDSDRHRLVLFGGQDDNGKWLNDTWEYILPEPPCYADLDHNGTLDLFDFLAYVNLFNAADPTADCDLSQALDFFDFLCFTNAFNAGC